MAEVHGTCDERFAGVREALARQLDGDELGASVAVAVSPVTAASPPARSAPTTAALTPTCRAVEPRAPSRLNPIIAVPLPRPRRA